MEEIERETSQPKRRIFQPNVLTNMLIEGACNNGGLSVSDFVNDAIVEYFSTSNIDDLYAICKENAAPINDQLKKEEEKMNENMKKNGLAKTQEVLAYLNVSRGFLRREVESGRLTAYKIGRNSYRYRWDEIEEYINSGRFVAKEKPKEISH